jgi:AcrR family transcriptional regulator
LERTRKFNKKLKQLTIIEAARELFLTKRYNSITMDEIARLAGITKKTLYTYFPSKLSLYIKLFEGYLQQLRSELAIIQGQNLSPGQGILASFEVLYQFTKKNVRFMRLYWEMNSEDFDGKIPEELITSINTGGREILKEGQASIIRALGKGHVLEYDPNLLWHIVSSINKGIFIHTDKERKFRVSNIDSDDLYQEFVKLLKEGFKIKDMGSPDSFSAGTGKK